MCAYLRVSTIEQTTANQERELRLVAERTGWEVLKVYKDHGISGAKGRDKRPAFNALHRDAVRRQFDVVIRAALAEPGRTEGIRKIAARFGVNPSTIRRINSPFVEGASVSVA